MPIFHAILNPEIYHGHDKKPPFFEGWYYKMVSADESFKYAIIPGVFLGKDGYAFIQVLDGNTGKVDFLKFPLTAFSAAKDHFKVKIAQNTFETEKIFLEIDRPEIQIHGELRFTRVTGWPISLVSPGVMGWYAWVPKMECYHGVLGFDHQISGSLQINGTELDFTGGRGYMEKDWGEAFPEGYVWMQTNHFTRPKICLTASIAMIPWLGNAFRGFIVGLWIDGKLYRFATYTGAKTERLNVTNEEVIWHLSDRRYQLHIRAARGKTGDLKGPTRLDMGMRVAESLMAEIDVKLIGSDGQVLLADTGRHGGLEVAGNIHKLLGAE